MHTNSKQLTLSSLRVPSPAGMFHSKISLSVLCMTAIFVANTRAITGFECRLQSRAMVAMVWIDWLIADSSSNIRSKIYALLYDFVCV